MARKKYCACGCGKIICPSWVRAGSRYAHKKGLVLSKPIRCGCGCREMTKAGNKFIAGHNARVRSPEVQAKMVASAQKTMGDPLYRHPLKGKPNLALKGRRHSKSFRYKVSAGHGGDGESLRLHPYASFSSLQKIKRRVKSRDGSCIRCGAKSGQLTTHHVVPVHIGYRYKLCDDESNLVTVCKPCHMRIERPRPPKQKIDTDTWREFMPVARRYLKKFGYKKLLLDRYIR